MQSTSNVIDPDQITGLAAAGSFLDVCDRTVKLLIEQAGLPHHRIGRKWIFSRSKLTAWKASAGTVQLAWPEKKRSTPTSR